jgi:hypothetical protein
VGASSSPSARAVLRLMTAESRHSSREAVSSGGTALGTTLSASAQLHVSSGDVATSTTEIRTERAMRAAILPGRAGAIRVTSE